MNLETRIFFNWDFDDIRGECLVAIMMILMMVTMMMMVTVQPSCNEGTNNGQDNKPESKVQKGLLGKLILDIFSIHDM